MKYFETLLDIADVKLYRAYIDGKIEEEDTVAILEQYEDKLKELDDDDLEYEYNTKTILNSMLVSNKDRFNKLLDEARDKLDIYDRASYYSFCLGVLTSAVSSQQLGLMEKHLQIMKGENNG